MQTPEKKRQKWAAVQSGLVLKILESAVENYGTESLQEAYEEFLGCETEELVNPDAAEWVLFCPWFFYEWHPDEEVSEEYDLPSVPPAMNLAESSDLTEDERKYILECCLSSFSFFEILEVIPGKSLKLKDLLTEEYFNVLEKKGTGGVQIGDLFFGKVISIDGIDIMEACAPIVFPPQIKLTVLDFKEFLQKTHEVIDKNVLHDFWVEIIDLYREIYDRLMNPQEPVLTNTDGHLLIPHKLIFEIKSPESALEALHKLCFNHTKDELLEMAKKDKKGNIKSVEFPWLAKGNKKHKSWDNTVLGHIYIDKTRMAVEVNSKERAKKFQTQLKKLMPTGWKLVSIKVESIDRKTRTVGASFKDQKKLIEDNEKLMLDPEIQARMAKMIESHWENWVFESIPALGGQKPVDAVKTKSGRESLSALISQFERDTKVRNIPGQTIETFQKLRQRLGL